MKNMLNFAIAGCGRIAIRHAEEIRRYGKLLAVCDPDRNNALRIAAADNCAIYTDLEDLLKQRPGPDILVICTPNGLHAAHCLAALEHDCHVLCEKPFALHPEDCRKVIRMAENRKRKLHIVQSYRYNPVIRMVHQAIRKGRLGMLSEFQLSCLWNRDDNYYRGSGWKGSLELDGGLLYTQFSHFIDLLPWFFGDAVSITGLTGNARHRHSIGFEDMGAALMEFPGGIKGSLHYTINSYKHNLEGALTLFGDRGTVRIGGEYCNKLEYQQIEGYKLEIPQGEKNEPVQASNHPLIYRDFIRDLALPEPDYRNARESQLTVELIERIYRSSGR